MLTGARRACDAVGRLMTKSYALACKHASKSFSALEAENATMEASLKVEYGRKANEAMKQGASAVSSLLEEYGYALEWHLSGRRVEKLREVEAEALKKVEAEEAEAKAEALKKDYELRAKLALSWGDAEAAELLSTHEAGPVVHADPSLVQQRRDASARLAQRVRKVEKKKEKKQRLAEQRTKREEAKEKRASAKAA